MYLSKLILNPRNAGARRDVAQPYELHRTLKRGVEDALVENRLLFRIEPPNGQREAGPVVLVQSSHVAPEWTWMRANGYALATQGPKTFDVQVQHGQMLAFRLVANPTVKKKVEGKKHSVRVPLIHDGPNLANHPTYLDWLARKARQHGFEVLRVQGAPFHVGLARRKRKQFDKADIPHFGVRFDGLLRVTDPDRFAEAVRDGIGPAKAFGFGLLSLAPAR